MDDAIDEWTCDECAETNDTGFDACWNCGTRSDGTPPAAAFVRDDAPPPGPADRTLSCLRCAGAMAYVSTRTFREGSLTSGSIAGAVADLFVDRETFDIYACDACRKVELFLPH